MASSASPPETAVMVIGAGPWQVPLIRAVRRRGLRCVATDRDPGAPGASLAHVFHAVGMQDEARLLRVARSERVVAALSDQTDRAVPVVARLNTALAAPGLSPAVAERFTDKLAMRSGLRGRGVAMPQWTAVGRGAEAVEAARRLGPSVVVKPRDNQASVGVTLVHDVDSMIDAFELALGASRLPTVLVEEYVDGMELTVEGVCVGGRCAVLAISQKEHYDDRPCVARSLTWPARLSAVLQARVEASTVEAATGLGLIDGLLHAEFRVRDGVPYLVEIAARGGGSGIASLIVPHLCGVDVLGVLVGLALRENPVVDRVCARSAALGFFDFGQGRVVGVHGVDALREEGVADVLEVPVRVGDVLAGPATDRDRVGRFVVLGEDREEVDARAAAILERVRVDVEQVA